MQGLGTLLRWSLAVFTEVTRNHQGLENLDVGCAGAFGALTDLEAHLLVFFEGFETVGADLGVVSKQILATTIRNEETITFFSVEPLNDTSCPLNFLDRY